MKEKIYAVPTCHRDPVERAMVRDEGLLKAVEARAAAKFVVKKTNLREIRETLGRAQRIVMTHERFDEFGPMLESIMTDLKAQTSKSSRRN